jgi:hypothetical protein
MISLFRQIFARLTNFFPNLGKLNSLGFKARIYNQDFILTRKGAAYNTHLHQSLEPFNRRLGPVIDFNTEGTWIILEQNRGAHPWNKTEEQVLKELAEKVYLRENYFFLTHPSWELDDESLVNVVLNIDAALNQR